MKFCVACCTFITGVRKIVRCRSGGFITKNVITKGRKVGNFEYLFNS